MRTSIMTRWLTVFCGLMAWQSERSRPAAADDLPPAKKETIVTVTDKDNGGKRELALKDCLVVRLEVRLGTGFSYQIVNGAETVLKPLDKPKTEPGQGKPGSKEYQVFRFQAVKAGTDKLELHYRRPFDKKETPSAKVFRLQVTVKE